MAVGTFSAGLRALGAALVSAVLVACSSGSGARPLPLDGAYAAGHGKGKLVLRIRVPKKHHRERVVRDGKPAYISPATEGITVSIVGPTTVTGAFSLQPTASGCSSGLAGTLCTLSIPQLTACPTSANCYNATIATYDAIAGCPSACAIPVGANELSDNQNFGFSIVTGKNNLIGITLEGIPASVALVPNAGSALTGNQSSGFVFPKTVACSGTAQKVQVLGVDADGNYILGAGAPSVSLASSNAGQLAVPTPPPSAPNTFALTPPTAPAYAYGNYTVVLTATVTPGSGSDASAQTARFNVTYSGDICGVVTEYPVPTSGSEPLGITAGPDGALWFTEFSGGKIGRITTGGTITETSIPTASSIPTGIAAGPDGALWFTEYGGDKIGRITTGETITETSIPTSGSRPIGIAAGPDGALWFSEWQGNNVGRITTGAGITETSIPTSTSGPWGITAGPDGALWFAEEIGNKIGRITTGETITETSIPTSGSTPLYMTAGPDGALWFTECKGDKIGRITTGGTISNEYSIPTSNSYPQQIVTGPDGALWFTQLGINKIGRISTLGTITETSIPTAASGPQGITLGPDGAIWFTECVADKIAQLR